MNDKTDSQRRQNTFIYITEMMHVMLAVLVTHLNSDEAHTLAEFFACHLEYIDDFSFASYDDQKRALKFVRAVVDREFVVIGDRVFMAVKHSLNF